MGTNHYLSLTLATSKLRNIEDPNFVDFLMI